MRYLETVMLTACMFLLFALLLSMIFADGLFGMKDIGRESIPLPYVKAD